MMKRRDRVKAFTLLELLVAVVILAILASMSVAGLTRYRDRADVLVCATNERVQAAATKLSTYDNNSLPGELSDLKPEYLERAYAQLMEETRPYTVLAFLQEWIGEGTAEAYILDSKYLGPNPLKTLTCPADRTPPPGGNSYAMNAAAANQPLSFLNDPANAGLPLVFESDDGVNPSYRHGGGKYCVGTTMGGVTEQVEVNGNCKGGGNFNSKHGSGYWPPRGSGRGGGEGEGGGGDGGRPSSPH